MSYFLSLYIMTELARPVNFKEFRIRSLAFVNTVYYGRGILGFGTWVVYLGGGEDNLFPSERIEMMYGFTNCTSTVSDYLFLCSRLYALPFTSLILIMIFIFHFGRKCPPPRI
jgi:hypothetical protein